MSGRGSATPVATAWIWAAHWAPDGSALPAGSVEKCVVVGTVVVVVGGAVVVVVGGAVVVVVGGAVVVVVVGAVVVVVVGGAVVVVVVGATVVVVVVGAMVVVVVGATVVGVVWSDGATATQVMYPLTSLDGTPSPAAFTAVTR